MDAAKVEKKIFPWLPLATVVLLALFFIAVIAVNSREGDIRSKVAGVKSNLASFARECGTSIQAANQFPFAVDRSRAIQSLPERFAGRIGERAGGYDSFQFKRKYYFFARAGDTRWMFVNTGPDRQLDLTEADLARLGGIREQDEFIRQLQVFSYDPSNGTRSGGDITYWSDQRPR